MRKILFVLDHKLHDYRIPVFDMLSVYYEVTVVHRGPAVSGDLNFSQVVLRYSKLGAFEFVRGLSFKGFDIVVFMQNLRVVNIYSSFFIVGCKRVLFWGIGTSSSKGLGKENFFYRALRNVLTLSSDGLALYSSYPLSQYWSVNRRKIEVVGNSVESRYSMDSSGCAKEFVLFIGALNKRKGLMDLLESFSKCLVKNNSLRLVIVGDGPERESIANAISQLGLVGSVEMLGYVSCALKKADIFSKAYFVVSPYQAGLSVVESFSFGVPFVTSVDSITGGEALSIFNNENGVLFSDISELDDVMCSFFDGRRDPKVLGNNAYNFYTENLTIDKYVGRFVRLIDNDFI